MVADQEPRNHNGNRPGGVEPVRQGITPHHQRQRDNDFHLIVVDPLEHPVGDQADRKTQQGSADRFLEKKHRHTPYCYIAPAQRQLQDNQKHHNADAVVKERFSGNLGFEAFGDTGRFEDADDRHRVGRRNQRPEQQAVNERYRDIQEIQNDPRQSAHNESRGDDPHGGQYRNGPFLTSQVIELDVHGPGKQQKRQHAVQQRLIEINCFQQPGNAVLAHIHTQPAEQDDPERGHQRDKHDPDGGRHTQKAVIDITEKGRHHHQYGCYFEKAHF